MATKKITIPDWVKSPVQEVCISVAELKEKTRDKFYMLASESDSEINLVACPHSRDVAFFGAYFRIFKDDDMAKAKFIHGTVMDPDELPYEISVEHSVFIFYDDWSFVEMKTMDEAIEYLNKFLQQCQADDTSGFVIVIGRAYPDSIVRRARESIEKYENEMYGEGSHVSSIVSSGG